MKWRSKAKRLKPEELPKYLLGVLYRRYSSTGQTCMAQQDLNIEFAAKTVDTKDYSEAYFRAIDIMVDRGWVSHVHRGDIVLLSPGIDHARWLMRPWYVKMWDFFKGDVRTIVVAIVSAVVITIVTNLVLRALGWGLWTPPS